MKLHKRRLAGLLLTCALLLGLLPAAALAVDLGDLQNVTLSADGVLSWDRLGDCHNYQLQIHAPDGQQILIGHISGSGNDVHYSKDIRETLTQLGCASGAYRIRLCASRDFTDISNPWTGTYDHISTLPKLGAPSGLRWDGTTVRWDAVPNAYAYVVRVYKDEALSLTVSVYTADLTGAPSLDLARYELLPARDNCRFTVSAHGNHILADYETGDVVIGPWSRADAPLARTLTVSPMENGTVTADQTRALAAGQRITLTVSPANGCLLKSLTVRGADGSTVNTTAEQGGFCFDMQDCDVTVSAEFVPMTYFADVPDDAYCHDAVLWAAANGVTGGTDATHFSPNAPCTRAQAVTFLWRAAGSPITEAGALSFTDVPDGAYYRDAVLWAAANGITGGTDATHFSPNASCTRGQIVTFLYRSHAA